MKHYHGSGACIFASIVMLELQVRDLLKVRKSVATISLQLGPRSSGDRDAVAPAKVWGNNSAEVTGRDNRSLVKTAVLDEMMSCQQW